MFSRIILTALVLLFAASAAAQEPRADAIWARATTDAITLDGVLDELAWAQAESMVVEFGVDAGIPGSGYKIEAGFPPSDPVYAVLKLLVVGNEMYLGVRVNDLSVGGSTEFNRFDGLLMALKDQGLPVAPAPPAEYLYSWWQAEGAPDPQPAGQQPTFVGSFANWPPGTPRDQAQIDAWDAVTVVHGLSNDDAANDTGYTVEMRFELTTIGYDVTDVDGDIVEWNISIYDCDFFWPISVTSFSASRVWWQSPWGNATWYNEVRVHARPDVTTTSGPAPTIEPEMVFHDLGSGVVVDGVLNEAQWTDPKVYSFDIRWDDAALRETYDGVGPSRAGQFQPPVSGGTAFVSDPADATVKAFLDGDTLYMGFDVRDQVVQFHPVFDRWDGFLVNIQDRGERGLDNQLLGKRVSFQVNADGTALPQDDLNTLITEGKASVALTLKANTVVDTIPQAADEGYFAELAIDLTGLGYSPGLDDRVLFLGVNHLDGDSFANTADSYGTRTWWYQQYEEECCSAWVHMEPRAVAVDPDLGPSDFQAFARAFPNPSQKTTIQFSIPETSRVVVEMYNIQGRRVEKRDLGLRNPGVGGYLFEGRDLAAGIYLYRVKILDPDSGALRTSLEGKTVLLK